MVAVVSPLDSGCLKLHGFAVFFSSDFRMQTEGVLVLTILHCLGICVVVLNLAVWSPTVCSTHVSLNGVADCFFDWRSSWLWKTAVCVASEACYDYR